MDQVDPGRRSRRSLLLGGLAGAGAAVATAIGRPFAAVAADGDPLKAGRATNASATTTVVSSGGIGIKGVASSGSGKLSGVLGVGTAPTGRGVTGMGPVGVLGQTGSPTGIGSWGLAKGAAAIAVLGRNDATTGDAVGVKGVSASESGTGVLGVATSTAGAGVEGRANGVGVFGRSNDPTGIGVQGTGDGHGVKGYGMGAAGVGVFGSSQGATGVGGSFEASGQPGSMGLKVLGRAEFSSAGVTSIASGKAQQAVSPGVELTGNSKVLATLQSDGGVWVTHVVIDTGADSFVVHLSGQTTSSCSVAWFVIG